jgi:transglutaminase 1
MLRADLGDRSETGGWQVIDATPQEKSDEMYQCGPASVFSVRRGEIKRPFDGQFVFSEVNADKVYWHYRGPNRPLKLLGKKLDVYVNVYLNIMTLLFNVSLLQNWDAN